MISKLKTALPLLFLLLIVFFIKPGFFLNFWMVIFVFIQSVLLFYLIEQNTRNALLGKIILFSLPILIGVFIIGNGIYKDTFKVTSFEKNQLWVRQELYRRELGIFGRYNFGNRFIEQTKLIHDKINKKITEPYELTHYFSTENFSFYSLFFLPFFVLGFLFILSEKIKPTLYYLGLATIGAILVPPDRAYWLFLPLVNLGLLFGVKKMLEIFKK